MDPAPGVVRVLGRRQRVQERSQGGPARKRSCKRQKRGHGRLEAHSGVQTTTNESQGSDGGRSQGEDGKNRYLFVAREEKTMSTRDVCAGTSATQTSSSSGALSSDQSAPYFDGISSIEMAKKEALRSGVREFEMDMPGPDTEEGESFAVAAKQANAVHAKYRYGAVLVSGVDFCPVRFGNNSKPFQRKEIHAEAAVLKGAPKGMPAGKTMFIARLPPRTSKKRRTKGSALPSRFLNARPCERCFSKMSAAQVRWCFFTKPTKGRLGGILIAPPSTAS